MWFIAHRLLSERIHFTWWPGEHELGRLDQLLADSE